MARRITFAPSHCPMVASLSRQPVDILDRMDIAVTTGCRLILITAPVGSSQSDLLREWISSRRMLAAWFKLQHRHNEPKCFLRAWRALIGAIDKPQQEMIISDDAHGASLDLTAAMVDSINSLSHCNGQIVLVLQEYDRIKTTAIHAAIDLLLSYPPAGMLVAMTSQVEPPLAISRLRARRQLLELGAADLARWRQDRSGMADR